MSKCLNNVDVIPQLAVVCRPSLPELALRPAEVACGTPPARRGVGDGNIILPPCDGVESPKLLSTQLVPTPLAAVGRQLPIPAAIRVRLP